jgi:hypothetical protein
MKGRRVSWALAGTVVAALATAPSAQAFDRYAEPGGPNSGFCLTPATACDLEYAIETAAGLDENVHVAPGNYPETSEVFVDEYGVDVIGPGAAQATLNSSAPYALQLTSENTSVSGLRVLHSGDGAGLALSGPNSLAERISVSTTGGQAACRVTASPITLTTIRDSACRNVYSGGGAAIFVDPNGSPTVLLRNVTAYATAASSNANGLNAAAQSGQNVVVNARNSIFQGTTALDIFASGPGTITLDLDFSAFADTSEPDGDSDTSVTAPGSLGNITAAPQFASTTNSFNQAAGSPTIDRGSSAFASALDIDGEARTQGASTDIGADEFPAPPPTATPTQVSTTKKKRCKRKGKKRRAAAAKKKRCKRKAKPKAV